MLQNDAWPAPKVSKHLYLALPLCRRKASNVSDGGTFSAKGTGKNPEKGHFSDFLTLAGTIAHFVKTSATEGQKEAPIRRGLARSRARKTRLRKHHPLSADLTKPLNVGRRRHSLCGKCHGTTAAAHCSSSLNCPTLRR